MNTEFLSQLIKLDREPRKQHVEKTKDKNAKTQSELVIKHQIPALAALLMNLQVEFSQQKTFAALETQPLTKQEIEFCFEQPEFKLLIKLL